MEPVTNSHLRVSVAKQPSHQALNFQIEAGYVFLESNSVTCQKGDSPTTHSIFNFIQESVMFGDRFNCCYF